MIFGILSFRLVKGCEVFCDLSPESDVFVVDFVLVCHKGFLGGCVLKSSGLYSFFYKISAIISLAVILSSCSSYKKFNIPKKGPWHCATERPYVDRGRLYKPQMHYKYNAVGYASWYGENFHNKPTSMGMRFDCTQLTAAHRTLPLPCVALVTNLENGRSVKVLVNDRGPFFKPKGRIIDVSCGVAKLLGGYNKGVFKVHVKCLPEESRIAALLKRRKPYPYSANYYPNGGYYQLPSRVPYIPVLNARASAVVSAPQKNLPQNVRRNPQNNYDNKPHTPFGETYKNNHQNIRVPQNSPRNKPVDHTAQSKGNKNTELDNLINSL